MALTVITIGIVLTILLVMLSIIFYVVSRKQMVIAYYPSIVIVLTGVLLVCLAPILGKVNVLGVGYGGVGIACLFSAAISFFLTVVIASGAET